MSGIQFVDDIKIIGINPYVLITTTDAARLKPGWRKALPVKVKVNGKPETPWRINAMPVGDGSFYLYLHGEVRKASNTQVGDRVDVEVAFDEDYRRGPTHPMPDWFEQQLKQQPLAMNRWQALTPSLQKEILRYFAGLKSDAARQRNCQKALDVLNGNKGRFLARDWN